MLSPLLQISGVQSAFITDDSGHLLTATGKDLPPPAGVLVLAHATISAASEFGRRSGSGDCIELVQHHEGGLVLLRGLPRRQALVVRCEPETDMQLVRHVAAGLQAVTTTPPAHRASVSASLDLADALHAMPAW
ncbi:MAG: hypothetical protein ACK5TH_21400 [Prosthecobacter sp.]